MTTEKNIIEAQRAKVFGKQPVVSLVAPCRLGDGIVLHSDNEKEHFIEQFKASSKHIQLFIPASGSGSRMFQFLFDFLDTPDDDNRGKVERFLNHIDDFAFARKIKPTIKQQLDTNQINLVDFVNYIVDSKGLDFGELPKGLIPFHKYGYFILNPFQEQVLQAALLNSGISKVHFTIDEKYTQHIENSLDKVKEMSGFEFSIDFSTQDANSDSIAFTEDGNIFKKADGNLLSRPSGHGALLKNLNNVDADIIFIKNIDNIQHQNQAATSLNHVQYISGVLLEFNRVLKNLFSTNQIDRDTLGSFLTKYGINKDIESILKLSDAELKNWLNKPRRVCGMVKNEGQPGGGPFWVELDGKVSKQIVEKKSNELNWTTK